MADPLLNLKDLVDLSYDALPGPYFITGNALMAYDKFCQPQIGATLRTNNETGVSTSIFLSMMNPATIRDIARAVTETEQDAARYRYLQKHGLYEYRHMTGIGLSTAIDRARNEIYDQD